jgi:hypothetical protein
MDPIPSVRRIFQGVQTNLNPLHINKMKSELFAIGSFAALLASPLALADKSAQDPTVCGFVEECAESTPGDEILVDPIVNEDEVVEVTLVECEVPEGEVIEGEGETICDKDPAVSEEGQVPIDWVKRGESELENPDVIFYTTADGGVAAPTAAKGGIELGQDDKAAVIEGKGAAHAQVKHEKKGPVALVKNGRVFLR